MDRAESTESAVTNHTAWQAHTLLLAKTLAPVALLATGIDDAGVFNMYDGGTDSGNADNRAKMAGQT